MRRPAWNPAAAAAPGGYVFGINFDATARTPDPEDVFLTSNPVGRTTLGPNGLGFSADVDMFRALNYASDPNEASIPDVRLKGYAFNSSWRAFSLFQPVHAPGYQLWIGYGWSGQAGDPQRLLVRSQVDTNGTDLVDFSVAMPTPALYMTADQNAYDDSTWSATYDTSYLTLPSPDDAGADTGYTIYGWAPSGNNFLAHVRIAQL